MTRRELLAQTAGAVAAGGLLRYTPSAMGSAPAVPTVNPAARLKLPWTDQLAWSRVLDITSNPGDSWEAKLDAAQQRLLTEGGGVVYFPPGEYQFTDSLKIRTGIVLRGAEPEHGTASSDHYSLATRFEFPKYEPRLADDGTPIDTAFKGIYLEDPARASNCGIVNIAINRGHVHFYESEDHRAGANRLVYGCVITNAAVADPRSPDASIGQHAWQRYTKWHFSAIHVMSQEHALVANNRLAPSTDSFVMPGYIVRRHGIHRGKEERGPARYDVVFDYDNRPGITVNDYCIGAPGGGEPSGTPSTHPWGFRQGAVIRDNYIYSTGRTAIAFTGDGTICSGNVIRFAKDVWRQTNTGLGETHGGSTNDNRAVQMRGYRWQVEDNDYEVYRNWAADHKYYINDGEGLMHENHCNSAIVESVLRGNRGNAYLSLYKTGLIDGLLVEDNEIRVAEKEDRDRPGVNRAVAIFVEADHDIRKGRRGPCRNVTIADNRTIGGILLGGDPSAANVIRGNRNLRGTALIKQQVDNVVLTGNRGYEIVTQP
jgi:hypothetical protein